MASPQQLAAIGHLLLHSALAILQYEVDQLLHQTNSVKLPNKTKGYLKADYLHIQPVDRLNHCMHWHLLNHHGGNKGFQKKAAIVNH